MTGHETLTEDRGDAAITFSPNATSPRRWDLAVTLVSHQQLLTHREGVTLAEARRLAEAALRARAAGRIKRAELPINEYGDVDAKDLHRWGGRRWAPEGWARVPKLPTTRAILDEVGAAPVHVFVGFSERCGHWSPTFDGWLVPDDYRELIAERQRRRATEARASRNTPTEAGATTPISKAVRTRKLRAAAKGSSYLRSVLSLKEAQEASSRAKSRPASGLHYAEYAGSRESYRASRAAIARDYEQKEWALAEAADHLATTSLVWGWGIDTDAAYGPRHVLYVELPTGQVSFHCPARGTGPDYKGTWDGMVDTTADRIEAALDEFLAAPMGAAA